MKSRIIAALFALVLAGGPLVSGQSHAPDSSRAGCRHDAVFTVLPNGVDDTANLQHAFDQAVAAGRGTTVRLVAGIYHTRQIVATNFQGTFRGAGAEQTVLTNLPNLYVTPGDFVATSVLPPSAANPWPVLLTFVGGDFQVSDLGIRITGAAPTTGWQIFGFSSSVLGAAMYVVSANANAIIARVKVEGEIDPADTLFGYNVGNGIYFEGIIGAQPNAPISGSFVVLDSTFRQVSSGTPTFNVSDAWILISGNHFVDVGYDASEGFGLRNSTFEFSGNTVEGGAFGLDVVDAPAFLAQVNETSSTRLVVKDNVFNGCQNGLYLDTTFTDGSECLVQRNCFRQIVDTGIYLGPGTSDCVVKANTSTTIVNLGTDNVIENGGHKHK